MCQYVQKLVFLLVKCLLFGLIGGALFTVMAGPDLGIVPYLVAAGAGAGWQITRPMGRIAFGENGVIFTAFFFAVRVGLALVIGWAVLVPYVVYLTVQAVRN